MRLNEHQHLFTVHLNGASNLESKCSPHQNYMSYRAPKLYLRRHYEVLQSHQMSWDSEARLRRNAIKTFSTTLACMTPFTMHVHNYERYKVKRLLHHKLKELQRYKSRSMELLLATTTTPNLVAFRCMVPKKYHEYVPHTSVWEDGLENAQFLWSDKTTEKTMPFYRNRTEK